MKIAFIGDIVGRPGRFMIKEFLQKIRSEYHIDFVIANTENASHGFGITEKNAKELFNAGIDVMTGGNHSFDKKEILSLYDKYNILRPLNFKSDLAGKGVGIYDVAGEKLAVINAMGHYTMPQTDNVFVAINKIIKELKEQNINNIFIDFHAEATSEKRGLIMMLKGQVSGIIGTHTHIGTDDLEIIDGSAYLSDIGLSGCRDGIIGMDSKIPIQRFLGQPWGHFDIPKKCQKILQIAIMEINDGKTTYFEKLKYIQIDTEFKIVKTQAF